MVCHFKVCYGMQSTIDKANGTFSVSLGSWNAKKTVCRRWRLTGTQPGMPKHGETRDISEGDKPRQQEARQGARTGDAHSRFSAGCETAPLSRLR